MIIIKYIKKNVIPIIFALVFGFCLVGNKLFLYPIDKDVSYIEILLFVFLCTILFPISKFILNIDISRLICGDNKKAFKNIIMVGTTVFLISSIIEAIYLTAFYPGCVSWDFQNELAQALGYEPIDYQLNPLIMVIIRMVYFFNQSIVAIVILQCLIINVIITRMAIWAYKQGIKKNLIFSMTLLFFLMPNNSLMCITLSKDVIYTCAFLWILSLLIRWLDFPDKMLGRQILYIETAVCMLLLAYSRYNGIIVVIMVLLSFIWLNKNLKTFLYLILVTLLLIIVGTYLKGIAQVNNGQGTMFVGMTQDMFGVYYADGNLSNEAIEYLESIVNLEEYRDEYTPYWTYWESWNQEFHTNNNTKISSFIKIYMDTFLRNPIKLIRCMLCRTDPIWNITKGKEAYETWIWQTQCSRYDFYPIMYPEQSDNLLSIILNLYGNLSQKLPFRVINWRAGIWFLIGILLFFKNYKLRKKIIVLWIPLIGQIISMAIANGWSHYRYYWNIEVYVYWMILLIAAFRCQKSKMGKKDV